ncbi:hypothetical protein B0H19DRAFT_1230227, partial [Mycena capillaripes]
MSSRPKRSQTSARPGKIINDNKQKRRSPDEKAADDLVKAQTKAASVKAALEAHEAGVQRIAALRLEDKQARKTSARPDLVTAELKRKVIQNQKNENLEDMGERDETYEPDAESSDDDADDSEAEAVQKFLEIREAEKKKAGKRPKAVKGVLRMEINDAGRVPIATESDKILKRRPSGQGADQTNDIQPKKTKTAIGGLKKGWEKAVGLVTTKPKTSTSARPRVRADSNASMPSLVSSRSSIVSMRSANSSVLCLPLGEFDGEETPASLQAARGSKSADAM